MYNLVVGFIDGEASATRVLEYTDEAVKHYVAPSGTLDVFRLVNLPTLVMPELEDTESRQVARVGHIENLSLVGRISPLPSRHCRGLLARGAEKQPLMAPDPT